MSCRSTILILFLLQVAKEDIQVRFYEDNGDWEAFADFQPTQVYKQHSIWFKTPKYKNLDITEPVKVFIQLRRPSDGATSEALPFEFIPRDSGRRSYVNGRGSYHFFNSFLTNEPKLLPNHHTRPAQKKDDSNPPKRDEVMDVDELHYQEPNYNKGSIPDIEKTNDSNNVTDPLKANNDVKIEKSYNQIINQVDELDEIYSENQTNMLKQLLGDDTEFTNGNIDQFDDAKTYSSLQMAFKNPVKLNDKLLENDFKGSSNTLTSKSNLNCSKRESDCDKPPLPPKRTKKIETYIGESNLSINQCDKQSNNFQRSQSHIDSIPDTRSLSVNFERPKSQIEIPPSKCLPATPNCSTLPNPKKRGFFSKLFGRKSKTANNSRETSLTPSVNRHMYSSSKSLQVSNNNLGKSSGNISTVSSNSIRIPLKEDPSVDKTDSHTSTIGTINDNHYMKNNDFDINLDVTEAEHYALYTTVAPYATQSEFDEMSAYYAPVEGGKFVTNQK